MARFRLLVPWWRGFVLSAATGGLFATAPVFAQVPPIGASAEVRDAAARLLANAVFREGRGEVLITLIFPSPPALTGTHGLRITSVGRCDPPDFTTAGAGFNPSNKKHGRQNPDGPQVGDLPNVNFTNGLTSFNTSAVGATLAAGQNSLLGPNRAALVIYSGQDDQRTDPDGNAGTRIGCGVITPGAGVAAQPVVPKPAASPAAPRPSASPLPAITTPTAFVPVVAVPTAQTLAAPAAPSGGSLGSGQALLIAIVGVGLVGAGYLLRRRSQLMR